jgi:hypothetical protein
MCRHQDLIHPRERHGGIHIEKDCQLVRSLAQEADFGSLAIFAAMLRATSRASKLAAVARDEAVRR